MCYVLFAFKNSVLGLGMVFYTCNSSTQGTEEGKLQVWGKPGPCSEICLKKPKWNQTKPTKFSIGLKEQNKDN
jgi:hypothetical protein